MKKLLSILSYLPIIVLGVAGCIIVVDMWQIAGVGRNKVTVVDNERDGVTTGKPSVTVSPAPAAHR
ncbi:MAG: hypothetical protein WBZ19_27190 [Chthoniobacterales bacterium]